MDLLTIILCLLISAVAYFLSYRQFRKKGVLLNNAYLFASKEEREHMDKSPYYRQSGIVFGIIGVIFMLNALSVLVKPYKIFPFIIAIDVILLIYAIASSIWIEMKKKA